jgi:hypothetical protein
MSAFFVSKTTIDNVVQGARKFGVCTEDECVNVGKILMRSNLKSLTARYGLQKIEKINYLKQIKNYIFTENKMLSNEQIVVSCRCLEYQSCEYKSYYTSNAYNIIKNIKESAYKKNYNIRNENRCTWD